MVVCAERPKLHAFEGLRGLRIVARSRLEYFRTAGDRFASWKGKFRQFGDLARASSTAKC